jgi:hypothetical protein
VRRGGVSPSLASSGTGGSPMSFVMRRPRQTGGRARSGCGRRRGVRRRRG